ncbi:hypothetical protein A3C87_03020 [Candidatus Kaiserbacteria bacterium RIFCSPHIGHO2_02_FULL_49_34]|uniref:Co-chaperonin GroES n=1 Tax=Candidatus Kaiserbacteria bacterium RIFCSPHIGHO2_02_FULL_49_34 TaxID=1798491 RepID=A0A1F6DIE3_9BACT|nr:MAG: hypothetical protein A3C87_03020 [Candidatus Kaiserbacteria bacterium RIFCSPHIGHO2_02_FULL_49_34]
MKNATKKEIGIIPLGDRVLVRPLSEQELSTASSLGIILPDAAKKAQTGQGEVIAVGAGKTLDSGEKVAAPVAAGDRVLYSKYSYEEVSADGIDYHILSADNLLAVFK